MFFCSFPSCLSPLLALAFLISFAVHVVLSRPNPLSFGSHCSAADRAAASEKEQQKKRKSKGGLEAAMN